MLSLTRLITHPQPYRTLSNPSPKVLKSSFSDGKKTNSFSAAIQTTPFFKRSKTMPSVRRVKVFGLLVFVGVITLLFYTASYRQTRSADPRTLNDFYKNTVNGLNRQSPDYQSPDIPHEKGAAKKAGYGEGEDEEVARQMSQRLKEAAQKAKDNANAKAPKPDAPSKINGVGSAAEGAGIGRKRTGEREGQEKLGAETKEEHDVEVELNSILKKSPSASSPSLLYPDSAVKICI
jgi:hypothetical protein